MNVKLIPLQEHEKESFIRNIQIAFKKAVIEQFGPCEEEIIPRDHVIRSFEAEGAESYNIVLDGEVVGVAPICAEENVEGLSFWSFAYRMFKIFILS